MISHEFSRRDFSSDQALVGLTSDKPKGEKGKWIIYTLLDYCDNIDKYWTVVIVTIREAPHEQRENILSTPKQIMEVQLESNNETNSILIDASDVPTFDNLSSTFNLSTSVNHSFQSWVTTASRIIPLYSVIFLLAVIGNSLVILTLVQNKRMRTITNLFLLNLAVSDLFLGVFCMPFTLVGMLLRDFIFGEMMCKLLPYLQGSYTQAMKMETFFLCS